MTVQETTLQTMRSQLQQVLPATAELYDADNTPDGAGGVTTVWVLAATVKCRLDPLFYKEQPSVDGGVISKQLNFMLTVPHDAPLRPHQLVVINNREYRILTLVDEHSWAVARRAHLVRHV